MTNDEFKDFRLSVEVDSAGNKFEFIDETPRLESVPSTEQKEKP